MNIFFRFQKIIKIKPETIKTVVEEFGGEDFYSLQHEAINAQLKMAASPSHTTVFIPSGYYGIPLVKTLK